MKTGYLVGLLAATSLRSAAALPADSAGVLPPVPSATMVAAVKDSIGKRPWYRPRHLVLQTAGGLGMLTAGAGYHYFNSRLEADLLIGYVPKKYAGSNLTTFSGKLLYSPFRLKLAPKWQLLPLTAGVFFSHTHNTINDGVKGQYSADYYWFSHDNFYGPILSSRITYLAPPIRATGQPRKLSAFYELSSNNLYIISYTTNTKGLAFGKILTLALGVKVDF